MAFQALEFHQKIHLSFSNSTNYGGHLYGFVLIMVHHPPHQEDWKQWIPLPSPAGQLRFCARLAHTHSHTHTQTNMNIVINGTHPLDSWPDWDNRMMIRPKPEIDTQKKQTEQNDIHKITNWEDRDFFMESEFQSTFIDTYISMVLSCDHIHWKHPPEAVVS